MRIVVLLHMLTSFPDQHTQAFYAYWKSDEPLLCFKLHVLHVFSLVFSGSWLTARKSLKIAPRWCNSKCTNESNAQEYDGYARRNVRFSWAPETYIAFMDMEILRSFLAIAWYADRSMVDIVAAEHNDVWPKSINCAHATMTVSEYQVKNKIVRCVLHLNCSTAHAKAHICSGRRSSVNPSVHSSSSFVCFAANTSKRTYYTHYMCVRVSLR